MPQMKESTPEYTSFSEERRQVLGFLLTYLERRNALASEYYKKLISLNGIFTDDLNVLVQSISKAKSIAKKSRKPLHRSPSMPSSISFPTASPPSAEKSSFYELLGKTVMEFMNSQDRSIAQSIGLVDGKLKDLFQGLAINQQSELEAIDATVASLSNQQHTMSTKLEKLKGEYLSSVRTVEASFEELKKRALIPFPKLTTSFSLTKTSNYEKAFLDYSKRVESSRKAARAFYEEVSRIQDAFEEIESKKVLLKKKICNIEIARSEDTLTLLKRSTALSNYLPLFDELEEKCHTASSTYLTSLLDEAEQNIIAQKLPKVGGSDMAATWEISPPIQSHSCSGRREQLEQVIDQLLNSDEENSLVISHDAQKLLEAISMQVKGSQSPPPSSPTTSIGKSEYERLRISTYKSKSSKENSPQEFSPGASFSQISSPSSSASSNSSFSSSNVKKYVALYDSIAESQDELSFCKGDQFEALPSDPSGDQEEWIYVLHLPTGIRGYVPATYVSPM